VYQLSSVPNATNAGDSQNFSHFTVKRLPAEVLLDAVSQVAGSPERFPGMPAGTRTIQLWDNRLPSYFLDTFGRSERASPCECGKSDAPTMAQALHLMNAPEIEAKLSDKNGRIARLITGGKSRKEIVETLCLSALGRFPGEKERRIADRLFADRAKPQAGAEDFLWALLNSYEFLFVR
jgi:DNA-binding NarL/FixJ family response regulator